MRLFESDASAAFNAGEMRAAQQEFPLASGTWSPQIGRMAGVVIPLVDIISI
jgi:hypothetical protein